ncbi:MAG TPA: DUF4340 domain-containing protein [Gemmataceae bacterium]|jgi:hypothetical protein|nr:DUF4340 domain-containing protein [Gemmataceae bacterium]
MNLKTTITLLILAAGVGVLVWKGADLAPKAGLAPTPMPEAKGESTDDLADIKAGDIVAIRVDVPGQAPVYFKAAEAGKPLEMEGNWPVRRNEVEELVGTVIGLKSRFQPVPLVLEDKMQPNLSQYGLTPGQDPVVVTVDLKNNVKRTLVFGQAPAIKGENSFTRAAFVRVDNQEEVLRLGPDVLPVLKRPADFYRKRQLFPDAARVKVADSERLRGDATAQFLLGDAVTGITVDGPQGKYVLKRTGPSPQPQPPAGKGGGEAVVVAGRLADAWEIVEPIHDRADPTKLKGVLAAIPDLWVEQFLFNPDLASVFGSLLPAGVGETPLSGVARVATGAALLANARQDSAFLELAGLKTGATKITLTLQDGSTRSLLLGKTTHVNTRVDPQQPPPFPMAPPPPPKIIEEKFYYAKLADNPLIFEVKGEKLSDLLFDAKPPEPKDPLAKFEPPVPGKPIDQLRDPNPVRFESEQAVSVTITKAGKTVELKKTKADPKAESESARKDRWDLVAPFTGLAETKQVTDLLEALEKLSAKKNEIIDLPNLNFFSGISKAVLAEAGLGREEATTVTISFDPATGIPSRTVKIGKRDEVGKKMYVLGPEPTRLNMVEDNAFTLVNRDARAYRSLKLFDLGDDRVDSIAVQGEKAKFRLEENIGTTARTYVLTEPVKAEADQDKAKNLLRDLAELQATEYLPDPPSPAVTEAMNAFLGGLGPVVVKLAGGADGLDKPTAVVTLNFAGPKPMAPRTLTVGKARDGKPEYFARLDGSPSVFGIKKEVADALAGGSLALMPLQLWNGNPDGLTAVEIKRGNEAPYAISQPGGAWKITAPFDSAADIGAVNPLATALAAMRAEKYVAHSVANLAEYGFDMPALRIKFTLTERKVAKPGDEPKEETKERVLIVGKAEGEGKPGRFARLDGDNSAVFLIADASFQELDKPALELLNKKLLTVASTAVNKIELTGPDGPLTLQKEGNDWKPVGATFPVDVPTVSNVLRILSNLTALKFADYGDTIDWAKYGLDANSKPATVSVTAGMETHKLEVGKVAEGTPNDRYARVDGGKAVAVLPVTVARDLSKGKLDLVERTIFKFDPIDLQAIRRTMNGQEFEATLGGTNWEITKPAKIPADQPGLEELADRLSTLRAERVADVEGKDLAKYGLATPAAVLKLEMLGKGGKPVEKALKIGAPADPMKPDGERFAQADRATTVVVLNANISKRLLAEPAKFRDRSLATFVTADKIVITRDGKDITFTKAGGNWKMTQPIGADAEDEALRELHDALARLRAEEIVVEKAGDVKQYGLDKPERWRVFNGDKEVLNLLVGTREKIGEPGKQKDGFRSYAKLDKGDLVVLLDMSLTAKLAAEYRKRALWEPLDVAQATTIEVDTPDGPGSFKLMKGPIGWIDPMNPAERISMETVTDFLDTFAGLKAERFVEHDAKDAKLFGLEPPRKTITVTTMSGQKRTLFLGRVDESKRVYARPGDGKGATVVVVLSEADTARVNKDRGGFLVAAKKEEPEAKKAEPKKEPEPKKEDAKKDEPKKVDPKKE